MCCDCAGACGTQCTEPLSHIQSPPTAPNPPPPLVPHIPSLYWSTLYQPVCACQRVTPGWCPSLRPSEAFWLRSTPCLPNHLGAGYGDELLTTAGQPVPHAPPPRPAPDLLLTHLHGDVAGICFLSCVRCQPASPPPSATRLLLPAPLHPLRLWASNQKAAGGESHGQEVLRGASHWGVRPTEWSGAIGPLGKLCAICLRVHSSIHLSVKRFSNTQKCRVIFKHSHVHKAAQVHVQTEVWRLQRFLDPDLHVVYYSKMVKSYIFYICLFLLCSASTTLNTVHELSTVHDSSVHINHNWFYLHTSSQHIDTLKSVCV